jgi:hypothetical protein
LLEDIYAASPYALKEEEPEKKTEEKVPAPELNRFKALN